MISFLYDHCKCISENIALVYMSALYLVRLVWLVNAWRENVHEKSEIVQTWTRRVWKQKIKEFDFFFLKLSLSTNYLFNRFRKFYELLSLIHCLFFLFLHSFPDSKQICVEFRFPLWLNFFMIYNLGFTKLELTLINFFTIFLSFISKNAIQHQKWFSRKRIKIKEFFFHKVFIILNCPFCSNFLKKL